MSLNQLVIPIILVALAGLIGFYVSPAVINGSDNSLISQYLLGGGTDGVKDLLAEKARLNSALESARELKKISADLKSQMEGIDPKKLERLDKFLPDQVNTIDLIISINGIASRHAMTLKGIKLNSEKSSNASGEKTEKEGRGIGEETVSFTVKGPYESLLSFVSDLATSLKVLDIQGLSFTVDEKGDNQYNVELKTYWIK